MRFLNVCHKLLETSEVNRNDGQLCCRSAVYVALQIVLKVLLVFIMFIQIASEVLIMGKSEIIRHIMHDFSGSAPVNAFLALLGTTVDKSLHLPLHLIKGTEILMLLRQKRRLDVWKDTSQAERLSVGLQALCSRHLVCQISGYQYMGFLTQSFPLLSCSYPLYQIRIIKL